jgi:hypothetical protein
MEDDQSVIIRFLCKERLSPNNIRAPLDVYTVVSSSGYMSVLEQ